MAIQFNLYWSYIGGNAGLPAVNIVVGFHYNVVESKGTRDMLTRAKKAGKATFIFDGKLKEF